MPLLAVFVNIKWKPLLTQCGAEIIEPGRILVELS